MTHSWNDAEGRTGGSNGYKQELKLDTNKG